MYFEDILLSVNLKNENLKMILVHNLLIMKILRITWQKKKMRPCGR